MYIRLVGVIQMCSMLIVVVFLVVLLVI